MLERQALSNSLIKMCTEMYRRQWVKVKMIHAFRNGKTDCKR